MTLEKLLSILSLFLLLIVGVFLFIEEQPNRYITNELGNTTILYEGHGIIHDTHPSMLIGGLGKQRSRPIFFLASLFGILAFLFIITIIFYGMRTKAPARNPKKWLLYCSIVVVFTFFGVLYSYWNYINNLELVLFGSLPISASWVVYGIWFTPILFSLVYIFGFEQFIWNKNDEEQFQNLLKRKNKVDQ
tara:strand:+ start:20 stop:589 length:570 start_codon:yes stop_codon:yes gene_type:complete